MVRRGIAIAAVLALASVASGVGLRDLIARRSAAALGGAVDLDGSTEYFSDGTAALMNNATAATWVAWIKLTAGTTNQTRGVIVSRDGSFLSGLAITSLGTNMGAMTAYDGGGSPFAAYTTNNVLTPGVWHHLAGVFQKGVPLKVFLNGVNATRTTVGTPANNLNIVDVFRIGYDDGNAANKFAGAIDDVALFQNRILNVAEIAEIYNSGAGKSITDLSTGTNGLVRYWKLNDGLTNSTAANAYDSASGTYATGTGIGSGDWTNGIVPQ